MVLPPEWNDCPWAEGKLAGGMQDVNETVPSCDTPGRILGRMCHDAAISGPGPKVDIVIIM